MVGQVLPSAWNMDEQLKITPLAAKFQELMMSICAPTATTAASCVNTRMKVSDSNWQSTVSSDISTMLMITGPLERFAHAPGLARAEVLAGDGRRRERHRHGRQHDDAHDALPHAETGLRGRAEVADQPVDDSHGHRHEQELEPHRQANMQQLPLHRQTAAVICSRCTDTYFSCL